MIKKKNQNKREGNKVLVKLKNTFWSSKYNLIMLANSILLNIVIWIYIYWEIQPVTAYIPLHYNIYSGVDEVGAWQKIFIIPSLGAAFIVINYVLLYLVLSNKKILTYYLSSASFLIQIAFFIAVYFIVSLFKSGIYG